MKLPVNANTTEKIFNQAIVLPFQTDRSRAREGIGLGLHFLLGNILVLNKSLEEMWFGWRVKKIFPKKTMLLDYCRGIGPALDLPGLALEQKIRYWVSGKCIGRTVRMNLTDVSGKAKTRDKEIPFAAEDHLIGFREAFMDWTTDCALGFDEEDRRAALWLEEISMDGLDAVGRALFTFYRFSSYDTDAAFEIESFAKAAALCPSSFMALDLLGWARYRRGEYDAAETAFLSALGKNPQGTGAMAGLMWCAVMTGNETKALRWALQKEARCGKDLESVRQKTIRLLEKHNKKS